MSDIKKIIIDGRGLRYSTGRYTRKVLDELQKIDTENQYLVVVNVDDEPHWSPLKKSINFSRVTVSYRHYSLGEQLGFAKFLYQQKADLVHYTMPQQPLLYFRKHVTTIHDLILLRHKNVQKSKVNFAFRQWVFSWFVKWVARTSKYVLTVTDFARSDIVSYTKVNPNKVIRTYLAADKLSGNSRSIAELSGKKFIAYVGIAHVHKNLPFALRAFEELKRKHPDLHIAFAGRKTIHYERLQLLADAMENADSVHILGFIDDDQLRWLYENATAYFFPSLDEGFGLPALEAMHFDVPVASSNATCLPEVYGDSAEYFDPHSTSSAVAAVDRILSDKRHADMLIRRGHKLLKKYNWSKTAKEIHRVYQKALDN